MAVKKCNTDKHLHAHASKNVTKDLFPAQWNIWRPCLKHCSTILLRYSAMTSSEGPLHWGCKPLWLRAQHISLSVPQRPASPSRSVSFALLPSNCHAKQQNEHRRTAGTRYVEYMPSQPPPQMHTHHLNPVFFQHVTQFCLLLCLAAHSHSPSCLCPFCMCELRSRVPMQEGNLILSSCTCSQIPSLSQARIVPQLMERES